VERFRKQAPAEVFARLLGEGVLSSFGKLKGAPFYNASGCARCVSSRTEHPSHRSLAARVSAEAATILLRCYAVALYKGTAKAVGIVKPY
jgi:hypothetical protein